MVLGSFGVIYLSNWGCIKRIFFEKIKGCGIDNYMLKKLIKGSFLILDICIGFRIWVFYLTIWDRFISLWVIPDMF